MRRHSDAKAITPASSVKNETMGFAKNMNIIITKPIKIILKNPVLHTDFSARSGWLAPRFCPTIVAAALAIPQAGRIVNIITLMAIVYPASATLPKVEIIRMRKIQLDEAITN